MDYIYDTFMVILFVDIFYIQLNVSFAVPLNKESRAGLLQLEGEEIMKKIILRCFQIFWKDFFK